jgi:hypothetical protein
MPRAELNHSEIMPTFGAKSDADQIECGSIFMRRQTPNEKPSHCLLLTQLF